MLVVKYSCIQLYFVNNVWRWHDAARWKKQEKCLNWLPTWKLVTKRLKRKVILHVTVLDSILYLSFSQKQRSTIQTRFSLFDYSACNEMSPRQCQAILDRRELFLTKPIVYQANSWKIVSLRLNYKLRMVPVSTMVIHFMLLKPVTLWLNTISVN